MCVSKKCSVNQAIEVHSPEHIIQKSPVNQITEAHMEKKIDIKPRNYFDHEFDKSTCYIYVLVYIAYRNNKDQKACFRTSK